MLNSESSSRVDPLSPLIAAARDGDLHAYGKLAAACHKYLEVLARSELPIELQGKVAASDLVQETLLEGQRDFARFAGHSRHEVLSWLRRILLNNLLDANRRYVNAAKRQVGREVSLDQQGDSRHPPLDLPQDGTTPSQRLATTEEAAALQRALRQLPDHFQTVIQHRHRDGLTFPEIASQMNRSTEAVRKLWVRAIEDLRRRLETPDERRTS